MNKIFRFIFTIVLSIAGVKCDSRDYCSGICGENHVLCKFKSDAPATQCIQYEKLIKSPADQQAVLDKINGRRNKIAAGELRSLPSAASMASLVWNDELALSSQRWADQCVKGSVPDVEDTCRDLDGVAVGQNIATIYGDAPGLTAASLVDVWYMELLNMNTTILSAFETSLLTSSTHYDYFTQLAWANSTQVGCGAAKFREQLTDSKEGKNRTVYRLVCNFAPAGNIVGQPVYVKGLPCSLCPNNTCSIKFNALCDLIPQLDKIDKTSNATSKYNLTDTVINVEDENYLPFNFFSHTQEFKPRDITTISTSASCKKSLELDNLIDMLKKKLNNPSLLKDILTTIEPFPIENSYANSDVDAFVSKLYKKETNPTKSTVKSENINSTLLVDLIEAVIFRNGGKHLAVETVTNTQVEPEPVSAIKIQAELGDVKYNQDFTGHYFFPEDVEEQTKSFEPSDSYYEHYEASSDVVKEIEEINKNKATVDFIEDLIELETVTEHLSTIGVLISPDDLSLYNSGHNNMKKFLQEINDKKRFLN